MSYKPQDEMFLWWLADPSHPVLIGSLSTIQGTSGAAFEYEQSWLDGAQAIRLSEDMPLRPVRFLPVERDGAPGAIDDARPDRWGERIIRRFDNPQRLSVLEYLFFTGDDRIGALGVSLSKDSYTPALRPALPHLGDIDHVHQAIEAVMSGARADERLYRLLAPGASLGGARPKALLDIDGSSWIVKFSEKGDDFCSPAVEHASMRMARLAGINACETTLISFKKGEAVAVQRFDRNAGRRDHVISAKTALAAAGAQDGYPELALLLRRLGPADEISASGEEVFRRMVFNIMLDNTDDHEKNHAFYFDGTTLKLTPAYDVLPTGHALGYQSMSVGDKGAESTLENALTRLSDFSLKPDQAVKVMADVANVVDRWKEHFAAEGVSDRDLETLSIQIDRPALKEQRAKAIDKAYVPQTPPRSRRKMR